MNFSFIDKYIVNRGIEAEKCFDCCLLYRVSADIYLSKITGWGCKIITWSIIIRVIKTLRGFFFFFWKMCVQILHKSDSTVIHLGSNFFAGISRYLRERSLSFLFLFNYDHGYYYCFVLKQTLLINIYTKVNGSNGYLQFKFLWF